MLSDWKVTMEVKTSVAKTLSDWQTFFAGQTMQRAKEIAEQAGTKKISQMHLSKAALETIERLKSEIQQKAAQDDDRRAA